MLRVTTDAPLSYIAHETPFALTHPVTMILGSDEPLEASVDSVAREFIDRTHSYWLGWVRGLGIPEFKGRVAAPVVYDGEAPAARIARRKAKWTPTEIKYR